jgi:hypothetical protein
LASIASIGDLDDLESLETVATEDDGEPSGDGSLENAFLVDEESGEVVIRRRPNARLTHDQALNLAAWIIAVTESDIADVEELVRRAVESL